jgi:hypothetical protein
MAVLQNLASGGKPIYLQRPDYPTDFIPMFGTLNIPIVEQFSQEQLMQAISTASSNSYQSIEKVTPK